MNQAQISRMLRREVAPDVTTLEKLARALGKTLPEFQAVPDSAIRRSVEQNTTTRGARVSEPASSPSAEQPLSAEQIADEVGAVLEPLVEQLAAKGESVVARWLLAVAGEANDQSVDNVRPLIDLAREFLWRAEGSRRPDA